MSMFKDCNFLFLTVVSHGLKLEKLHVSNMEGIAHGIVLVQRVETFNEKYVAYFGILSDKFNYAYFGIAQRKNRSRDSGFLTEESLFGHLALVH